MQADKPKTKNELDKFQQKIGINFTQGKRELTAFLTNFKTKTYRDKLQDNEQRMALLCFFQSELGETLKFYLPFNPYFYVSFESGMQRDVQAYLEAKVEKIHSIELVEKIDLQELNHLSGQKKLYLKLSFKTIKDLNNAKGPVKAILQKRKKKNKESDNFLNYTLKKKKELNQIQDIITGMRQYDVPYHSRVCIDMNVRAGKWFDITVENRFVIDIKPSKQQKSMPDMKVLAYDIQTSKDPLKFPVAEKDVVMMISLMYEGMAFLIINTAFCGSEVEKFEYQPKPEFFCDVQVYNEPTEKDLLLRFAQFIQVYKPSIITSYNGDRFDYPFLLKRCEANYVPFVEEMGVNEVGGEFFGNYIAHLDCYYWVDRDAFLPQGSRGLKAVCKAKLNYDPIQVEPEKMVEMAKNNTQRLAEYSVSDAVATFFLYNKHIHGFIFALSTIIPMFPDEVLRKGSGTLCQLLLMAEAYNRGIIFPNKKMESFQKFYKGHLLDSETYTGGKVECLRTGVYRADFETDFHLNPQAFQQLISNVQDIIQFAITHEIPEESMGSLENLDEVKDQIVTKLMQFRDTKTPSKYETFPLIYHIDVAAMYPNIILTNRLQPVSIVNDRVCSGCLFNDADNNCKRELQWEWKGEAYPIKEGQYLTIKEKLSQKIVESETSPQDYEKLLRQEIKAYSQKIYKKTHNHMSEIKTDVVCMRENSFYVDTVRAFRDRRYEYKAMVKLQAKNVAKHLQNKDFFKLKEAKGMQALYESMQLAHKIILNSFYGYVMRKGARWYSMEMAAMVTHAGSSIISDSKNFVEDRIGKGLELDTDGIWMLLPKGFPEDVKLVFKSGKSANMSYPCHILNHLIYEKYCNPQYQTLVNIDNFQYNARKEMTIFFEIDGPYKAMMIPAAKEKQKTTQLDIQEHNTQMLKKRYVVFNFNNKIKQFKGFQMKRRGQLRVTKVFQEQIFPMYLKGENLKECYDNCALIAKKYINIILKKGQGMDLNQIIDYLQESRVLSKDVKEYGESKGVAINSAKRLADFLGPDVIKGKGGLCCYYIISEHPVNRPISERAIPTQIFDASQELQRQFLFKWTRNDALLKGEVDIKNILDWGYYFDRLSTQIQKMICIPAVLQGIDNPVPQIELPEWLKKKTFDMRHHKQKKLTTFDFGPKAKVINQTPIKIATQTPTKAITQNEAELNQSSQKMVSQNSHCKSIFEPIKQNPVIIQKTKNKFSMKSSFTKWLGQQKAIWKQKDSQASMINNEVRMNEPKSILQIIPEKSEGNFNVWYHSGGKIQQILITMKRRYYCKGKGGTKKAPREEGEAVEITIEQEQFKKQEDYFDALLGQQFYETKLPLINSLIMRKGNLWRVPKQSLIYTEDQIYEMFGDYLPNMQKNFMQFVFLSHLKVLDKRSLYFLFIPKSKEYYFVFVDNSKGVNAEELAICARRVLRNKNNIQNPTFDEKIKIQHFREEKQASHFIAKLLGNHLNAVKQPYLVVYQGTNPQNLDVEYLYKQLPVLVLPAPQIEVTLMDWKSKTISSLLSIDVTSQVLQYLEWSRYSQIPLCNLAEQGQVLDYITNISLGRLLHAGDNLTWWNEYNSEIITTYESMVFTGKIVNPGLFKTYCIQIMMENLAINTIANAEELMYEDRETALIMQKKTNQTINKVESLDQMSRVRRAFDYIKKMIKSWIKDFEETESEYANELLKNFHKWVTTRSNSLYDPLLTRMVNEMMKKVFYLLIKRLTSLGMHVVYANFSKIVVATDKYTASEAKNSIEYILKKCVEEDQKIFKYLSLSPYEDMYKCLIFKDQFNHVAIYEEESSLYYKFELQKLLPPAISKHFKIILTQFICELVNAKEELYEEYQNNKMKLFLQFGKMIDERMVSYINGRFKSMFISIVTKLEDDWQNRQKLNPEGDETVEENAQQEEEEGEGDEEDRQFIDDNEGEEGDEDERFVDEEYSNHKLEKTVVVKQKKNQQKMDLEPGKSPLDIFIENIYNLLSYDEAYKESLIELRKQALVQISRQPQMEYRIFQPVYPSFQLPCSQCLLVNEHPGNCEHCNVELQCVSELENSVWKMMQEQGRDLYCQRCNNIMQDYLKKCGCGGKWAFREFPLKWLPYTKRDNKQWQFVNKVFDFMGVES